LKYDKILDMKKTFRSYRYIFWSDTIGLLLPFSILAITLSYLIGEFNSSYPQIICDILKILLVVIFLLYISITSVIRLNYRIVLDGNELKQKGFFWGDRAILVSDISEIRRRDYDSMHLPKGKGLLEKILMPMRVALSFLGLFARNSDIPMIAFDGHSNFPVIPVNPKLIDAIILVKPDVKVSPKLIDLLSNETIKKLGMKRTLVDKIGYFIWRGCVAILIPLLLYFVIILLVILLDAIGLISIPSS